MRTTRRTRSTGRDELRELRALRGSAPQVIAAGRGDGVLVAVLSDGLAVRHEGLWSQVGWQEIQHGTWDRDNELLTWTLIDGTEHSAVLTEAGQVPGAFQERVQASILVQEKLQVPGGGSVVLSGRRNPAGQGDVTWMAQPSGRATMDDPVVQEFIVNQSERLADEYGL